MSSTISANIAPF